MLLTDKSSLFPVSLKSTHFVDRQNISSILKALITFLNSASHQANESVPVHEGHLECIALTSVLTLNKVQSSLKRERE